MAIKKKKTARRPAQRVNKSARSKISGNGSMSALLKRVEDQEKRIRQLTDRQEIMDCSVRFSRGINRRDRDVLLSAFHKDAVDDHGFFVGNREDFTRWIDSVYTSIDVTQHFVTNQTVDIDGDTAHAETYWLVSNVAKGTVSVTLRGGRYIDRLERRAGVWGIAARLCLIEWNCATGDFEMPPDVLATLAKGGVATTDKADPSYARPLRIARKAQRLNPHSNNVRSPRR